LLDRFTASAALNRQSEYSVRNVIKFWLTGLQPDVRINGACFIGQSHEPVYPILAQYFDETLIECLAQFHCGLQQMEHIETTFTMRTLYSLFNYLHHFMSTRTCDFKFLLTKSLMRYYIGRGDCQETKIAISKFLVATGLADILKENLIQDAANG
jgi:hypothetical protein